MSLYNTKSKIIISLNQHIHPVKKIKFGNTNSITLDLQQYHEAHGSPTEH
jgi:hypothetical protein